MGKPKILHVLKSSIYSGAENVVITIMKKLESEYEFMYLATDGTIRGKLEQEGIPFRLLNVLNISGIHKVVQDYQPDIVHAHDFFATVLCAVVPGRFRLISHLHYDPPWVQRWNLKTIAYILCKPRIQRVLTVSNNIFRSMIFSEAFKQKWLAIGNPIDVINILQMAGKECLKDDNSGCDVIFVGRLVEQKDPQRFIKLIALLKKEGWQSIRAWMLGTGDLMTECESMIVALGLQENINMQGFQSNPYAFIKKAKVMCITSRWEGYGLVALEANILGVPVLSTRNAGCSEIFGDTAEELCDTDAQFVQKLQKLHNNPNEYAIWKERSLKRSEEFDNMSQYMTNLSSVYRNEV